MWAGSAHHVEPTHPSRSCPRQVGSLWIGPPRIGHPVGRRLMGWHGGISSSTPSVKENNPGALTAMANFGQTKFGQTEFNQNQIWPNEVGPKFNFGQKLCTCCAPNCGIPATTKRRSAPTRAAPTGPPPPPSLRTQVLGLRTVSGVLDRPHLRQTSLHQTALGPTPALTVSRCFACPCFRGASSRQLLLRSTSLPSRCPPAATNTVTGMGPLRVRTLRNVMSATNLQRAGGLELELRCVLHRPQGPPTFMSRRNALYRPLAPSPRKIRAKVRSVGVALFFNLPVREQRCSVVPTNVQEQHAEQKWHCVLPCCW